jgi:hypothetical protein
LFNNSEKSLNQPIYRGGAYNERHRIHVIIKKFLTLWSVTGTARGARQPATVSDYKSTQKIQTLKEIEQ